jgi:hypothetical protein
MQLLLPWLDWAFAQTKTATAAATAAVAGG